MKDEKIKTYLGKNPNIPTDNVYIVEFPGLEQHNKFTIETINYDLVLWDGKAEHAIAVGTGKTIKVTFLLDEDWRPIVKIGDLVGDVRPYSAEFLKEFSETIKEVENTEEEHKAFIATDVEITTKEIVRFKQLYEFRKKMIILEQENRKKFKQEIAQHNRVNKSKENLAEIFRGM